MRNNTGRDSKPVTLKHREKVRKEMDEFIAMMNAEYEKNIIHIRERNSNARTPNGN